MTIEEAIRILKGISEEAGSSEDAVCYVGSDEDIKALDMAIEALQAEPKTGEWIPCTKNGLILTELIRKEDVAKWYGYKCSECNYIHKGNALIEYNFCPNCGAKMERIEE